MDFFNEIYNHYLQINDSNEVISAFSDAFQQPKDGDILLCTTDQRHCQLQIYSEKYIGKYKYWWRDGKLVEKTEDELMPLEEVQQRKVVEIAQQAETTLLQNYSHLDIYTALINQDTDTLSQIADFINQVQTAKTSAVSDINTLQTKTDVVNYNMGTIAKPTPITPIKTKI